MSTKAEIILK